MSRHCMISAGLSASTLQQGITWDLMVADSVLQPDDAMRYSGRHKPIIKTTFWAGPVRRMGESVRGMRPNLRCNESYSQDSLEGLTGDNY